MYLLKSKFKEIIIFFITLFSMGYIEANGLNNVSYACLILFILLSLFLASKYSCFSLLEKREKKILNVFTMIFTILIVMGVDYNFRHNKDIKMNFLKIILSLPGIFYIVKYMLFLLIKHFEDIKMWLISNKERKKSYIPICCIIFFLIFIPCIIVWANLFPGTYSGDAPAQIYQAVEMAGFDNMNPVINTFFLIPCIQAGMAIKDVGTGIAIYLFIIAIIYSLVWSYVCSLMLNAGFHYIVVIATVLFADWPINLAYVVSMYKDTFFAILFLLTLAYTYSSMKQEEFRTVNGAVLGVLSLLTSLARNSGWSSLLVMTFVLLICAIRRKNDKWKIVAFSMGTGVLLSLIIVGFIYPRFGIRTNSAHLAVSVQLQQVARVVKEECITSDEAEELLKFSYNDGMLSELKEDYCEWLVDPIRKSFNLPYISEHKKEFNYFWFKLCLAHPKEYFNAYIDHTSSLWWPDSTTWITDNSIFENDFGIVRKPLLFPGIDISLELYDILHHIPMLKYLNNSGFTFWMILISLYLCLMGKNIKGVIFCIPMLMIYLGLLLFAYCPLFRYTYSAVLSMPLLEVFIWDRQYQCI